MNYDELIESMKKVFDAAMAEKEHDTALRALDGIMRAKRDQGADPQSG